MSKDARASINSLLKQSRAAAAGAETKSTASEEVDEESTEREETQTNPEESGEETQEESTDETEESTEESQEESEEETEEEEEDPHAGKKAKRNRKVEERVQREVGKRKAAEAKLAKAEAELENLRSQSGSPELREIVSRDQVEQKRIELRNELQEVNDAIADGGVTTADGREITVKDLREYRKKLQSEEDELPKIERRIQKREQVEAEQVSEAYPDLLDEDSELFTEAETIFAEHPSLRLHPEGLLIVGDLLRGRELRKVIKTPPKKSGGKQSKKAKPPTEPRGGAESRSSASAQPQSTESATMNRIAGRILKR